MSGHSGKYAAWPEWMTRSFWHRLPREVRRDWANGWNMNRLRNGQPINSAFRRALGRFGVTLKALHGTDVVEAAIRAIASGKPAAGPPSAPSGSTR